MLKTLVKCWSDEYTFTQRSDASEDPTQEGLGWKTSDGCEAETRAKAKGVIWGRESLIAKGRQAQSIEWVLFHVVEPTRME